MNKSHLISFLLAAAGTFALLELFVRALPADSSPGVAQPSRIVARDFREPILHPSQLASQEVKLIRVSQTTSSRVR